MSDVAIRVENLSKAYRITRAQSAGQYRTLREDLAELVRRPFRRGAQRNGKETIWALKDVSFEVKHGEVLGIIGRNGAGKSTLLKILSRITEPTNGYADVFGRVGSLLEVGTGFHPELTGRENIFLNGAILGMSRREIQRKFDEIVAFAEIERFIDTPVKRYSSGMYVRLAFAVAAHLEPEILIVDEVLAVGDAMFQKKCLGKMGDVAREGRTVLFVSHNTASLLNLCSQAAWLESGQIVRQGEARAVVAQYMRDNRVPLGEVSFEPAVGSNGVSLLRAYVTDDHNQIRPDIPYEATFSIAFEYHADSPLKGLRVGFRLHSERGVAVLHTATSDCPALDGIVGMPGRHRVHVEIPGAWLAPGRYYADLGVWSPGSGHHLHLEGVLAFDVVNPTVESIGPEVLRPLLKWRVA